MLQYRRKLERGELTPVQTHTTHKNSFSIHYIETHAKIYNKKFLIMLAVLSSQLRALGIVPMCSFQYERMFNTTRIPGIETGKNIFHLCFIYYLTIDDRPWDSWMLISNHGFSHAFVYAQILCSIWRTGSTWWCTIEAVSLRCGCTMVVATFGPRSLSCSFNVSWMTNLNLNLERSSSLHWLQGTGEDLAI